MRLAYLLPLPLLLIGCPDPNEGKDTSVGGGDTDVVDADWDDDGYDADRDCNDEDASIHPDAAEICDGIDQDCDQEVDEDVESTWYLDEDGDGHGRSDTTVTACEPPTGYVRESDDCDDADASIYPGALEACDDLDNDCDGDIDEGTTEAEYYADTDGDGYGDPDSSVPACGQPEGYVDNAMDCDDDDILEPVHVAEGGWSGPDTGWGGWDTSDSGAMNFPGSPTNPLGSVQDGIDQARVCVHVHAGTYEENIDFSGKDIEVVGVDGVESTTISGLGDSSTVTFSSGESAKAILRGFTITGGGGTVSSLTETSDCGSGTTCSSTTYSYMGGGIFVDGASPTLTDLLVTGNVLPPYSHTELSDYDEVFVYSFGGGIYLRDSAISIDDVAVTENYADEGGGLFAAEDTYVALRWLVFAANSASVGAGVETEGTFNASNSVFAYNDADGTASYGGAGLDVTTGTASLVNVTFVGNDGLASFYLGDSATGTLLNSILVDNDTGYVIDGASGSSLTVTYSDVYGGVQGNYGSYTDPTGSNGNISSDPAFVSETGNWSTANLHLAGASPAMDAGNPAASYNDADASRNDMGAYGGPDGTW